MSYAVEDEPKFTIKAATDNIGRRTNGKGDITVVSPANSAVAPTVPSFMYIAPAKRGNAAANVERIALFAAMADAAIGRYAVTRYVKVEVKTK
jgi:hypothetical protein